MLPLHHNCDNWNFTETSCYKSETLKEAENECTSLLLNKIKQNFLFSCAAHWKILRVTEKAVGLLAKFRAIRD